MAPSHFVITVKERDNLYAVSRMLLQQLTSVRLSAAGVIGNTYTTRPYHASCVGTERAAASWSEDSCQAERGTDERIHVDAPGADRDEEGHHTRAEVRRRFAGSCTTGELGMTPRADAGGVDGVRRQTGQPREQRLG